MINGLSFKINEDEKTLQAIFAPVETRQPLDLPGLKAELAELGFGDLFLFEPALGELIQKYGYAITTESEQFGEMTSVFSFRNSSNGYYGGWMYSTEDREVSPEITDDIIEAVSVPK